MRGQMGPKGCESPAPDFQELCISDLSTQQKLFMIPVDHTTHPAASVLGSQIASSFSQICVGLKH